MHRNASIAEENLNSSAFNVSNFGFIALINKKEKFQEEAINEMVP